MILFETYSLLKSRIPDVAENLFGCKVSGVEGIWLSLDAEKFPHLLFETNTKATQPNLNLKAVEIRFACRCDIQLSDGNSLSGTFTIVSLAHNDPDIVRVFLRLLEETFLTSDGVYSENTIREQILTISDLFSQLDTDLKDVLGLWGELHIIRSSSNLIATVNAWSSSHHARYDFVTTDFALEVKTTLKSSRQHRFSLEQLRPVTDINVLVVSILLIEITRGETVSELMDQIYDSLVNANERSRFFRQCLRKGGVDIYSSELRVATLPHGASVSVFEARNLPVPLVEEEDSISSVKFNLNLSQLSSLANENFTKNLLDGNVFY